MRAVVPSDINIPVVPAPELKEVSELKSVAPEEKRILSTPSWKSPITSVPELDEKTKVSDPAPP